MILFGCKMNWLSLTCNLKWDVVEICQKYLTVVVKIMKMQKNHIYLAKYQKLITNCRHNMEGELFLYMCRINCIQYGNILCTTAINCSCMYCKVTPILSSKIRSINQKIFGIIHILSYYGSYGNTWYQHFLFEVNILCSKS